jgi:hypothetical protein
MKCPECSSVVAQGERFCGNCGAPIEKATARSEQDELAPSDETMLVQTPGLLEAEAEATDEEPSEPDVGPTPPPPPTAGGLLEPPEELVAMPPSDEAAVPPPPMSEPPALGSASAAPPPASPRRPRLDDGNRRVWIIVAVIAVLLALCCCASVVAIWLWLLVSRTAMLAPHLLSPPI